MQLLIVRYWIPAQNSSSAHRNWHVARQSRCAMHSIVHRYDSASSEVLKIRGSPQSSSRASSGDRHATNFSEYRDAALNVDDFVVVGVVGPPSTTVIVPTISGCIWQATVNTPSTLNLCSYFPSVKVSEVNGTLQSPPKLAILCRPRKSHTTTSPVAIVMVESAMSTGSVLHSTVKTVGTREVPEVVSVVVVEAVVGFFAVEAVVVVTGVVVGVVSLFRMTTIVECIVAG